MRVVILAGGKGTRLSELTHETPKPMLHVGKLPILQHIINRFVVGGFRDFIIPVGYLGENVKHWFRQNYTVISEDHTELKVTNDNIVVTIVDTGFETLTGGRLLRLKNYLTEPFMMTYGDGISNINPKYVREYGEELNKNVVTAVHPVPRFGSMSISPTGEIISFDEKLVNPHDWINGGFFYLKPSVLEKISGDSSNFEKDVLPKVVWESDLYAFQYEGLWHCIDTVRDLELANILWKEGKFK